MSEQSSGPDATLDTAIILSTNIKKLADFYGQGLELGDAVPTGPEHLGYALPNSYLGFDLVEETLTSSGVISLWFRVNDIQSTFKRFKDLGADVKYGPTEKPWGDTLAALYDPDGNLFGLALKK